MWWSLLIRLGMFALTMGVIVWIGWTVPQAQDREAEHVSTVRQSEEPGAPATAVFPTPVVPARSAPRPETTEAAGRHRVVATLDLNRASEEELDALPGIGPALAGRIVAYRREAGLFQRVEDLRAVKGIGKKTFEKIRALVNVAPPAVPVREGKRTT